jgi:hypothetical protein
MIEKFDGAELPPPGDGFALLMDVDLRRTPL